MKSYLENTWQEILPSPTDNFPVARSGHASCFYRDKHFFIYGGYSDKEALSDMHRYKLEENVGKN